jgi:hypothetical protein
MIPAANAESNIFFMMTSKFSFSVYFAGLTSA